MTLKPDMYTFNIRIRTLELTNFRGFRNLFLAFEDDKPVHVFIADNGGGKSTILDAIASLLDYFLHATILSNFTKKTPKPDISDTDILNRTNTLQAKADVRISYPMPNRAIFQFAMDCADWLNETELKGNKAELSLGEDDIWILDINNEGNNFVYSLPETLQVQLENIVNQQAILTYQDRFLVCKQEDNQWVPNLDLTAYDLNFNNTKSGNTKLAFELPRGGEIAITQEEIIPENIKFRDYIQIWEEGRAILSEFQNAAKVYSGIHTVLPLLAYYGGSTIKIRRNQRVLLPYEAEVFQAYKNAMIPERFDAEEFIAWAIWINEKDIHTWRWVEKGILDAFNSSTETFTKITIETQRLNFFKKINSDDVPIPVEITQLSAGEKNIIALVGDIIKKAIQLNPVLFQSESYNFDETFSSPFAQTTGIVLIDEIDLHLHPKWQRAIIPVLRKTFPKVQFIVTTHSPFVVQSVEAACRILLKNGVPEINSINGTNDYEATLIDYFLIYDFYDMETEKGLAQFRYMLNEVKQGKRMIDDALLKELVLELKEKGNTIKQLLAFELSQLKNQQSDDKN